MNTQNKQSDQTKGTSAAQAARGSKKQKIDHYKSISQKDHVLLRPGMYVGSVETTEHEEWIYDDKNCTKQSLKYCEALSKIINEAVDNAADNTHRNPPTTHIWVSIQGDTVSVSNNGCHIPVEQGADGDYVATTIFGKCLSGSNYDDKKERRSIGLNGLGIKLCNILSNEFTVSCIDPVNKKKFTQTWTKNMSTVGSPTISKASKKDLNTNNPSTTVSFRPDLTRFKGVSSLDEIVPFIKTRLLQMSATLSAKIFFNGEQFKVNSFKQYMSLFEGKQLHENVSENFEYGFKLSNTDQFEHQSFVNNLYTPKGGTHLKLVSNAISNVVHSYFSKKYKNSGTKLSRNNILGKLHVFVNISVVNPMFTSQSKVELSTSLKSSDYPIDEKKVLSLCKKVGILDELEEMLNSAQLSNMNKQLNGSKKKSISIPKLDDAQAAGGPKSLDCTLFLTEGDSAKTMVSSGFSVIGRKYNGVFPLKGKMLNVKGASTKQITGNDEIKNIMKILGLSFNKTYDNDEDMKTLRYGKVCATADGDNDGFHICALLYNFIHHFFPALARRGYFLYRFITPLIKTTHKRTKLSTSFFSMIDYERFAETNNMDEYTIKYYKGLGTSTKAESLEYFGNLDKHLKRIVVDDKSDETMNKIFNPKLTDVRKEWISDTNIATLDYDKKDMNMTKFLETEVLGYSKYSLLRAIPSAIDFLKVSNRKILFASLKKFGASNNEFKVAQLASYVASETLYAHGENSLAGAIVNLAQSFCGSNNLPLLEEGGAFGSRLQNGADASSPRYIFTRLRPYVRALFPVVDDNIISHRVEENEKVEPYFFVPTIPLLCNGSNGIATGYRSSLPNFSPIELIDALLKKTSNNSYVLPNLKPYYNNYKGEIVDGDSWEFSGVSSVDGKKCTITELPIGISIEGYKDKVLDKLVADGKITSFVVDHPSENEPRFILNIVPEKFKESDLKLTNTMSKQCMNFLDENGCVKTFTSISEILEYWHSIKMRYMNMRKTSLLASLQAEIKEQTFRLNFIKSVISGDIDMKKDKAHIVSKMKKQAIPKTLIEKFLQMSILSICSDRVNELEQKLLTLETEHATLTHTTVEQLYINDLTHLRDLITKTNTKPSTVKKRKKSNTSKVPSKKKPALAKKKIKV